VDVFLKHGVVFSNRLWLMAILRSF